MITSIKKTKESYAITPSRLVYSTPSRINSTRVRSHFVKPTVTLTNQFSILLNSFSPITLPLNYTRALYTFEKQPVLKNPLKSSQIKLVTHYVTKEYNLYLSH